MPRLKIDPSGKSFDIGIKIPVRISDINYGNHVGNDSMVGIIHEARVQLLQHFGYTELNIEGKGLIMSGIIVEFKNESFYNDMISFTISVGEISRVSFELFYRLTTERKNEAFLIAIAKTTMICYDYELKKVTAIPEKFLDILGC